MNVACEACDMVVSSDEAYETWLRVSWSNGPPLRACSIGCARVVLDIMEREPTLLEER